MKMFKIIAVTATLFAGASAAYASPFNAMGGVDGLSMLSDATYATVLTTSAGDVPFLRSQTDTQALQQRIANNPYLAKSVHDQGYEITDVIGLDASGSSVTLYVL
ncbi:hypothetical protein PSQ90_06780 [Devosia rhodophyticola]|uniref:DUF1318 domain-containing protein n=1 Tax=Devosia rhodophyticola TaxID=3026423 RepID=A0ABY7Z0S3_9HYPH|nr:hypothetical protein [Devosia rhodophyticola]WDR07132.1 hypothetical protein PSQ90_06780 [Devosia rhodophyticola]